jgi:preprotein translocase subunit SecD
MDRKPTFVIFHTLLSLLIFISAACAPRHEAAVQCPAIEMSAVADTQTDSTRTVTLNDTATLLLERTPLVATADITGATASEAGGKWVLNVTVTDDAAKRVEDFSKQHVGTKLAVLFDGKLQGMPRIASAIVGNSYQIDGLTRATAEAAATAISNGCHR